MAEPAVPVAPPQGWQTWLQGVYQRLYGQFGPLHWWPAETPFEVIVGAILVQNVAWSNTEKAIANLKAAGLLQPGALLAAPAEQVEALIRPSGYFRAKAKKLKLFCSHLQEHYGGSLDGMFRSKPLADLRQELLGVWGIGPETADCILCYAGGLPIMAMDAYTRRVFSRLGVLAPNASYEDMQAMFHHHLPADAELYGEYHAQIDALANRICRKRAPLCEQCPLNGLCPSAEPSDPPMRHRSGAG